MESVLLISMLVITIVIYFVSEKPVDFFIASAICGICLVVLYGSAVEDTRKNERRELAKEVNLEQVSVQGERVFQAQIRIAYKDGKLEPIALIPGTTIFVPSEKEVEKK